MPFRQVLEKMDKMPFGLNIISPEEKKKPYDIHIDNRKVGKNNRPTSSAKYSQKHNYRRYLSKNEAKQKASIEVNQEPDIINKIKAAFGLKQQEDNKNFQLVNTNPAPPSMANITTQQPESYSDNISNPPIFKHMGQDDADDLRDLIQSNEEREGRQLTYNEKRQLKEFLLEQKTEAEAKHSASLDTSAISDITSPEIEEISLVATPPRETRSQEANRLFQEETARNKLRRAREEQIAKANFEKEKIEHLKRMEKYQEDRTKRIMGEIRQRSAGKEPDLQKIRNAYIYETQEAYMDRYGRDFGQESKKAKDKLEYYKKVVGQQYDDEVGELKKFSNEKKAGYYSLFGDVSPSLSSSPSTPASPFTPSESAKSAATTLFPVGSESTETHPREPVKKKAGRPSGTFGPKKRADLMASEPELKEKARLDALKGLEEGGVAARTPKKK